MIDQRELLESVVGEPYFNNAHRVAQLLYHAGLWMGTPWCANSASRGPRGGVSCHNLPRALYMETGALPDDFPEIRGDPNGTRHTRKSVIEPWLDARPEFRRVPVSELAPGDLLGIRIYHCVDHLGVVLTRWQFIHVLMHKRTTMDPFGVSPWRERIGAAWRPTGKV
mgnify:CR=1 FL=1